MENGISGVLVPAKDKDALAAAMEKLFCDSELRESLAKAARERAEKYFDRPIMLKNQLEDINTTVLHKEK